MDKTFFSHCAACNKRLRLTTRNGRLIEGGLCGKKAFTYVCSEECRKEAAKSQRKFYKRTITFEILSESELPVDMTLEEVDAACFGDNSYASGITRNQKDEVICARTAARLLGEHGSDTEFFGLTEDGEDTEED